MVTLDQAGAGSAWIRLHPPPPRIGARVEHAWLDRPPDGPADASWRIVADHCPHLLYHRYDGRRPSLLLAGPRTVATDIDRRRRVLTVGVRLRPWALPALFDATPAELADRTVRLEALVGPDGATLEDRLLEADGDAPLSTLLAWIERRARPEKPSERRARQAVQSLLHDGSCRGTARAVGRSTRGLRLLIRSHVGLPPKTLARLARLHRALRRIGPRTQWSRIAVATGYYDQAHLIREFRSLLGETPETWRKRGEPPA